MGYIASGLGNMKKYSLALGNMGNIASAGSVPLFTGLGDISHISSGSAIFFHISSAGGYISHIADLDPYIIYIAVQARKCEYSHILKNDSVEKIWFDCFQLKDCRVKNAKYQECTP